MDELMTGRTVFVRMAEAPHTTDETAALRQQLAAAEQQIRHLQEMQQNTAALLSYELRTQFTTILGSAELLTTQAPGALNDKQSRLTAEIGAAGRRAFHTTTMVMEYQALAAGTLVLDVQCVDAVAAARAVLGNLAEEAAARQQRLQLTVSPQTMHGTVYVSADPERLQLMLDQLLRHALRCTPAGGGVELAVKVQAAGDIEFRVSNNGGSICADELALLFLPFAAAAYRRERTATFVAIPGVTEIDCINGARRLGLVLTRDLAERHGGGLTVENRAGQGSNFRLSLPSAASTAALTAAPAA